MSLVGTVSTVGKEKREMLTMSKAKAITDQGNTQAIAQPIATNDAATDQGPKSQAAQYMAARRAAAAQVKTKQTQTALLALSALVGGTKVEHLAQRKDNKQSPSLRKVGALSDHDATVSALATDPLLALMSAINPAAALRSLQDRGPIGSYRPTRTRGKVGRVPARGKHAAGTRNNASELAKAQRPTVSDVAQYVGALHGWGYWRIDNGWYVAPNITPNTVKAYRPRQLSAIVGIQDLQLDKVNKRSKDVTGTASAIGSARRVSEPRNYTLTTKASAASQAKANALWANIPGDDARELIMGRLYASLGNNGSLGLDVHNCWHLDKYGWIQPNVCHCAPPKQLELFASAEYERIFCSDKRFSPSPTYCPIGHCPGHPVGYLPGRDDPATQLYDAIALWHKAGRRYGKGAVIVTNARPKAPSRALAGGDAFWQGLAPKAAPIPPEWRNAADRQAKTGTDPWWHVINRARAISAKVDALSEYPEAQALARQALTDLLGAPKAPRARRLMPKTKARRMSLDSYTYLMSGERVRSGRRTLTVL